MTGPGQPGWYDDPFGPASRAERYWDGQDWTPRRRPKRSIPRQSSSSKLDRSPAPDPSVSNPPQHPPKFYQPNVSPPVGAQSAPNSFAPNRPGLWAGLPTWAKVVLVAAPIVLIAIVAMIAIAGGHSSSWQKGYESGRSDPAAAQKIILEGGLSRGQYCQDLLTLARLSRDASSVDGSDFLSGCQKGVDEALSVRAAPQPRSSTAFAPAQQPNPYPDNVVVCDPLRRWDPGCELGKP